MVAFDEVAEKITDAARQIEPDRDASPVLVAVVPGVPVEACEGSRCSALGGVHYGAAEWDFEGVGEFPTRERIGEAGREVRLTAEHTYDEPGTYFAVVRITARRDGDADSPYRRIQNLARVRVVVE